MSLAGFIVCIVIISCVVIYTFMAKFVSNFYRNMTTELLSRSKDTENQFNSTVLENIYRDYTEKAKTGLKNINTGSIIEKYIPVKILKMEWALNYFQAMSIVLGLFGTLLGMVGALSQLSAQVNDPKQTDDLLNTIREPISHIATAFITSLSGIGGSILMNFIAMIPGYSYRNEKYTFYNEIEDFLDNEEYARVNNDGNGILIDFTNKVEASMKYMTDKVTKTFDEGIGRFADKINGVSFDITESAKTLTSVIGKLETSVNNFNKPVLSFKESVDSFRIYYEGLDTKIKDMDRIAAQLVKSFESTIEALNSNKSSFIEVGSKLKESTENLSEEHEKMMELVERISQYSNRSDDQTKARLDELKEIYKDLQGIMYSLKNETSRMSEGVAQSVKEILSGELERLNNNLNTSISESISLLRQQNESFKESIEMLGRTINTFGVYFSEIETVKQDIS